MHALLGNLFQIKIESIINKYACIRINKDYYDTTDFCVGT